MIKKSPYIPPCEVGSLSDYAIVGSYDARPPFLGGPQYFGASEEVDGQLSESARFGTAFLRNNRWWLD